MLLPIKVQDILIHTTLSLSSWYSHKAPLEIANGFLTLTHWGVVNENPSKEDSARYFQKPGLIAGYAKTTGVHSSKVFS